MTLTHLVIVAFEEEEAKTNFSGGYIPKIREEIKIKFQRNVLLVPSSVYLINGGRDREGESERKKDVDNTIWENGSI